MTPYGITCENAAPIFAKGVYSVSAGISQWQALSDFCETYGGFTPRITRQGKLVAVPEDGGALRLLDENTTLLSLTKRENHYGVLSEITVIDKTRGTSYTEKNQDFIARGGNRRRVLYTPGQSSWADMRYTGQYRIAASRKDEVEITAVLPGLAEAEPGDTVRVQRSDCGIYGDYRVAEVEHRLEAAGESTVLVLKERE